MLKRMITGRWLIMAVALVFLAQSGARASLIINLTTAGASDNTHSGAIGGQFQVTQVPPQPTGTGFIDSFLRIQKPSSDAVRGYNTSLSLPFEDLAGPFTRALSLSEIPVVNIGGTNYRQFLLDINQTGSNPQISLNQIQIFQSPVDRDDHTGPTGTFASTIGFGAGATEIFRLNNNSDPNFLEIQLDFSLNSGSGSGDMFLYVRDSNFNAALGSNVILHSQFGTPPGGFENNDGFEEWAVLKGQTGVVVPEPATILSAVTGLASLGFFRLRRRRQSVDVAA